MAAITESELLSAFTLSNMSALEVINPAFTPTNSPTFEAASYFPNGRSEKFLDFNGSSQYLTYDASGTGKPDQGIVSFWIKPDFDQTGVNSNCICDDYENVTGYKNRSLIFYLASSSDDWYADNFITTATGTALYTIGQTWAVDAVIHVAIPFERTAGLDGTKSMAIYINNTLVATGATIWAAMAAGQYLGRTARIGAIWTGGTQFWDGGIFDWSKFDYTTLAASHTDAEIVQALYSNTFNSGSHKFSFELGTTPPIQSIFTPKVVMLI